MRAAKRWHQRFTSEGLVLCAVYFLGTVGSGLWAMSLERPHQTIGRVGCDIAQLETARVATLSEQES